MQARAALDADDLENIRGFARGHLRELTGLDRFIGDVLALVNPATTDIMFSTDNSVHLGEVRMKANLFANKNTPYLVTMNSPLIVAGPSWPHLPRTAEINVPTQSSVDMAATYNAIFGATPALGSQAGVDLRDVAVHPESYASRQLLHQIKIDQSDSNSFPQDQPDSDAISTATRHLIRYIGQTGSNKYELYALDTDPWELHNRANDNGNDPLGGTWANTVSTLDTALNALLS